MRMPPAHQRHSDIVPAKSATATCFSPVLETDGGDALTHTVAIDAIEARAGT